jgi:phosphoglycolate phosphatase
VGCRADRPVLTLTAALLFDLDGCLVDSLPSIRRCWERTLPEFGAPPPGEVEMRHLVGPPVNQVARHLLPDADEALIAAVVARYRRCSAASAAEVPAFPGVPELLDGLRERGIVLGLATSKSIEVAEPTLEALGLRGHFAVVEGTRLDELGTDKATVVGRALAGLAPDVPIGLVGDRRHDIEGAHAHGIAGFGALWGYGGRAELEAADADALLAQPADVTALVK